MKCLFRIMPVFALVLFSGGYLCGDEPVRSTVAKAVPFLKSEGKEWIKKRACVSCHQIPFMQWSLALAHKHGFDVSRGELEEWKEWSTKIVNFVKPERKKDVDESATMAANIDTMSAMMLGLGTQTVDQPWRVKFSSALVDNQKEDGSWNPCGQLPMQKRPKDETTRVTTLWTLLALKRQGSDCPDSAIKLIDQELEAKSTEWWVARILVAHELKELATLSRLRNELLGQQNDNGGWGWLVGEESDALATGMALYAIGYVGVSAGSDTAIEKAVDFLASSQNADGSWNVPGTKQNARNRTTKTATYWGTAWGVIGLLESGKAPVGR